MIQPLVFTSKEFANKGLMCNSILFSICEGCLVIWENCQILEYLLAWEKCSYIKLLCVPQSFRNVRFCSATCIFFFATRYHCFEIYAKFAVILTGLWSKNSCGRVRKQERNARETFSTPMRRMKIRCRQGRG